MKKLIKWLINISTCILLITIGVTFINNKFIKVQNAFDEMYFSQVDDVYRMFNSNSKYLFYNMKQLELHGKQEPGIFSGSSKESYSSKYLEENQELNISLGKKNRKITFMMYYKFSKDSINEYEDTISLKYSYDVSSRTLTKLNIRLYSENPSIGSYTEMNKDIEDFLQRRSLTWEELDKMQEDFLYNKFLKDWFEANEGKVKYSLDDLGKIKIESQKGEDLRNSDSVDN